MQAIDRELSAGEIISRGLSLAFGSFLKIIVPLLLGAVAVAVVRLFFAIQLAPLTQKLMNFSSVPVNATNAGPLLSLALESLSYAVLEEFILFIVSITFFAMALKVAFDASTGKSPNFKEAFSLGFLRIPTFVISGFVVGVIVFVGLALLVVPGILFILMFLMFIPAIALENASALGSLGRSRQLASHRWGVIFIVALVAFIISALLGIFFGTVFSFLDSYSAAVVQPFYGLVSDVLGVSFLTILYQSLRMKEGAAEGAGESAPQPLSS